MTRKFLLRISLQNFDCLFHSFKSLLNCLSFFGNVLGFTKSVSNSFILVDLRVEFKLKFFLRHFNKEISNCFWDCISDISHNNSEISINSSSDFLHKSICTCFLLVLSILLRVLLLSRLTIIALTIVV